MVEEPRKEWQLRMEIAAAPRAGAVVATLRDAVVRRGDFTLGPVDLQIDWRDRVAITGANGAGKSTLLAALLGRLRSDAGQRDARPGRRRRRGGPGPRRCSSATSRCWTRSRAQVPGLAAGRGAHAAGEVRAAARTTSLRPAATLSPGERTRAALALLQARGVNLLVLDEPTNHLDLPAIEQLESALASYPGTLLLVTHDRRMLADGRAHPVPARREREGHRVRRDALTGVAVW